MITQPFVWGDRGEQMTPEQVARRRAMAQDLAKTSADFSPVGHWTQALARGLGGYLSGRSERIAGRAEEEGLSSADEYIQSNPVLAALLGGDQAGMQQPSGAMSLMETASPQSGTIPSPAPNEVQADPGISNYFAAARQSESGGNNFAKNPNSSALGPYQFIDSTWRGMMEKYPELGLTWDGRTDPDQSERAMQRFTADNAAVLERSGIPVDGGSLYAAHFLGPGGAVNALSQPDQTPMAAVVGDGVVKANPFLANMTVGDFRSWSAQKGGGGAAAPGGMSGGGMPQQGPSPVVGALAQAMGNPWVAQKYGPVMEALMGQEMQRGNMSYQQQLQQADPMYQAQLQHQQLQNHALMNPQADPWQGVQEINGQLVQMTPNGPQVIGDYRTQDQFQTVTGDQAAQLGLDPAQAYNIGPDGRVTQIGGGGVTVNNNMGAGADEKAYEEFAKLDAQTLASIGEAGMKARQDEGRIDRLESLLASGPSGMGAGIKTILGDYGIQTDGLDTLQAARALINAMVPEQRQPGSGPMSDADLELFKQSLPRLINSPDGNALIVHTLRGISQYDAQRGDIVQQFRNGELTRAETFAALNALQNPLSGFGEQASRFDAPEAAASVSGTGWSEVNGVRIRRKGE